MTVCPSCKRRKATAEETEALGNLNPYGAFPKNVDAVCWQGGDCILPPNIRWWAASVEVIGPTGDAEIEADDPRPLDRLDLMVACIGIDAFLDPSTKCPAPLPGERP